MSKPGAARGGARVPSNRPNSRGNLRFDREFAALRVPRIQRSSGTSDPARFARLNGHLTMLATLGCADELRAFASGEIGIHEIEKAFQERRVHTFLAELRATRAQPTGATSAPPAGAPGGIGDAPLGENGEMDERLLLELPLWETALDSTIPRMGVQQDTRRWYATSLKALRRKMRVFAVAEGAFQTLADVSAAHWEALDVARMRGLTRVRLFDLLAMPRTDRRAALKVTDTRVGEDVFETLASLSAAARGALDAAGEYLPDGELVAAMQRLDDADRRELRAAAARLGPEARVGDLGAFSKADWWRASQAWGGSGSDWNHLRRALSAVLTTLAGTEHLPFRRRLIERMPVLAETERVPDLDPATLLRICGNLPEAMRAFPVAIVLTGTRIGEFERLTREHLVDHACVVNVPGTKTLGSRRSVQVDPEWWHYVRDSVPTPRGYGWMRREWVRACAAEEVHGVTLHDLRHCHGQWAAQRGVSEQAVQVTFGHRHPGMTRRYTKAAQKGEVAEALGGALRGASPG